MIWRAELRLSVAFKLSRSYQTKRLNRTINNEMKMSDGTQARGSVRQKVTAGLTSWTVVSLLSLD